MNDRDDILRDLEPDLDRVEAERLAGLGSRLRRERPAPSTAFVTRLAQRYGAEERPSWWLAFAYAVSGSALLAVAALGAAGSGPLAP
jgi:hypothetical protein